MDVAGFSFGGLCGGLMAAANPSLVKRLVLVGAPGLGIRDRRLPLTAWRHLEDREAQLRAHRQNLAALMLYREESIDALALAVQAANVPRDRMQRRRLAMTDALSRALTVMRCPVDAIYEDSLLPEQWKSYEAINAAFYQQN